MNQDELLQHLRRRPAVHQLCSGAFIQEPIGLMPDVLAVPLQPIGYRAQAQYTAQYASEIANARVDTAGVSNLESQGREALPVISVVRFLAVDSDPEALETLAAADLEQARRILGWISGDGIVPFALLTLTATESYFRLLAPHSRRRQRLGFGNTGVDFHSQVTRLAQAAEQDERFAFALSLHHDALRETSAQFRIARLFNCLECLAYRLKKRNEGKSRKAVKDLLGLEEGATAELHHEGTAYHYDVIEVAGRIRDKLFHGAPFEEEHLNAESKPVYRLYTEQPGQIADTLLGYCELEIARWANGASRGLRLSSDEADAGEERGYP